MCTWVRYQEGEKALRTLLGQLTKLGYKLQNVTFPVLTILPWQREDSCLIHTEIMKGKEV